MSEPAVPEPDYDDPKDIYAFFGLAYYCAQVLEQGVVNLAVALRVGNRREFSSKDINELYERIDKNTFGKVFAEVCRSAGLPRELERSLRFALEKRNYLAHSFFVTHANDMRTKAGRSKMINELRGMIGFIKTLDQQLDEHWIDAFRRVGLDVERVRAQVERLLKEKAEAKLPPSG